jgi:hypothetical protein
MKLSIEDFRQALDLIGEAGGTEAAIVAQFAFDLAVTARSGGTGIAPQALAVADRSTPRGAVHVQRHCPLNDVRPFCWIITSVINHPKDRISAASLRCLTQ